MIFMTDFENVSELVKKTGASFEEARYAYEACGKDMLAAAEMLEKAHYKNENPDGMFRNVRNNFRKGGRYAAGCAGNFFKKLCQNYVSVSGRREYFCMPVIAAVLCLIFFGELLVPVVLISLLFGVTYTFYGPDFSRKFVFGFIRPDPLSKPAPTYDYKKSEEEPCDNGFFNK